MKAKAWVAAFIACAISINANALEVTMSVKSDGKPSPSIIGQTNLPNGTTLLVDVGVPPGYWAQSSATVSNGSFKTEAFSRDGAPLQAGNYAVTATVGMAQVQPQSVQAVFGDRGKNLTGPLIETDDFGSSPIYKTELHLP